MARTLGRHYVIVRDVDAAARREFDLVVVGGGIYGASLMQEAARRGLSVCLCEAEDFGGGTSWNSLRILHGGLRYLQTADLGRFFRSFTARRRLAQQFPSLVRPLRCVMPLHGRGLKRASVMRMALLANDLLSSRRNRGLPPELHTPSGRIIDAETMRQWLPLVRRDGLEAAACWSDYYMISSERILIELLRDACRHGAIALNYVPATEVLVSAGRAYGVRVWDRISGRSREVAARAVVNCAGPRARALAAGQCSDAAQLFWPSLAFNLLLEMELPVGSAFAVSGARRDAPVLFIVPQRSGVLVGTMHVPRSPDTVEAVPTEAEISEFLTLLNEAVPGLNARHDRVRRVWAGLLPVTRPGGLALLRDEKLWDHGSSDGVRGMYSVSGVKFTTAAETAQQLLREMGYGGQLSADSAALPLDPATPFLINGEKFLAARPNEVRSDMARLFAQEAVFDLDDLLLRRTNWAIGGLDLDGLRSRIATFGLLATT